MADKKQTLSIVYEEPPSRPWIPVNGAIGGVSPDGSSVIANLYVEGGTLPALEDHEISVSGSVDLSKGNQIRRGDITRMIQATLVMAPEAAIRIGKWLAEKGQNALDNRSKTKP